jgi:small subunit ribosomal protein S7
MRRAKPEKREILPDIRYNNVTVQTMIHHMLHRGKKSTAIGVVYDMLDIIKERNGGKDPIEVFETALNNVMPVMEVRPRRVGGATYQVPMEVPAVRRVSLAMRWIMGAARARTGRPIAERLATEILDAANNTGTAVKRREDTHRMAEANRAFAHYRW